MTFKAKKELYKALNDSVFQTLYTIVDFNSFKADVLNFKKTLVGDGKANTEVKEEM